MGEKPENSFDERTSKLDRALDAYACRSDLMPVNRSEIEHQLDDFAPAEESGTERTLKIDPPKTSSSIPKQQPDDPDDDPGVKTATSLGRLITETCRNLVSSLTNTRISDWNETVYEEDEPINLSAGDREAAAEELDDLGRHIELQQEIARGGQACINKGFDKKFNRIIAVKSLHDELKTKKDYRKAFISEAKVTAQLEHPAIIPVYGIYEDGNNGLHLSMKLVRGRTLKDYLERTRLHYRKMSQAARRRHERTLLWKRLDIFHRVCEAISYVHHRNVIHRDLKPENIMIGSFNETYVMDWGIAEYQKSHDSAWGGKVAGTLQYISPEVINKHPYDTRSDIFLLGLILFEIAFLKQAYARCKTKEEAIYKARRCQVEPFEHLYKCRVDINLRMIIGKALAPNPDRRYQTVRELVQDLNAFTIGDEVSANPDNIFDKILRKVRLHYKMLLFFCVFLMLAFTTLVSVSLYREVRHRQVAAKKDRAMVEIYSRGMYSCSQFDRRFRNYEYLLSTVASEAALLYKADKIQNQEPQVYTLRDLGNPETTPPDFSYSPTFMKNISLDYAMFVYPDMAEPPSEEYVNMMKVLHLLKDSLRATVVNSLPVPPPEDADAATVNKIIRNTSKPLISWVYAGFRNGLHIAYPPRTDVSPDYDPRQRGWYTDALKSPHAAHWSVPYVDTGELKDIVITCSRAILDENNRPLGVAGADISLTQLLDILNKTGNNGEFIKNKFLVDKSGNVIADSSERLLATRIDNDALEFRHFPYSKYLAQMWEEKNGWFFSREGGVNYLYFHLEVESLQWLYIERIDFEELLKLY